MMSNMIAPLLINKTATAAAGDKGIVFIKMHGLGNDFIILDGRHDNNKDFTKNWIKKICHRRLGIGCDQLVVLKTPTNDLAEVVVVMEIFNNDGTAAEVCGNATRAVALLIHNETGKTSFKIASRKGQSVNQSLTTDSNYNSKLKASNNHLAKNSSSQEDTIRLLACDILFTNADAKLQYAFDGDIAGTMGYVKVDMGLPKFMPHEIPLKSLPAITTLDTNALPLSQLSNEPKTKKLLTALPKPMAVNVGNPHCVFFVEDITAIDVEKIGAIVEQHPLFPERTNVEFIAPLPDTAEQILPLSPLEKNFLQSNHGDLKQGNFRLRVWERGAGLTLACGSGAVAAFAALLQKGKVKNFAQIQMDGGWLQLSQEQNGCISMTGSTNLVGVGCYYG